MTHKTGLAIDDDRKSEFLSFILYPFLSLSLSLSGRLRFVDQPYLYSQEVKEPPKFLTFLFLRAMLSDPGRPSRISPNQRSLRLGFRFLNIVAVCSCSNEAESLQGGAYSLTAHRIPCVRFVWVVQACLRLNPGARPPFQSRNTRYRWLAKPCLVKTFTLQEMPSFAWRTEKMLLIIWMDICLRITNGGGYVNQSNGPDSIIESQLPDGGFKCDA